MIKPTEKIWHNGEWIPWDAAQVHVLSHVIHYGTSVFEGIRCYDTENGPAVFRLPEHIRRMYDSAKVYRMDSLRFTQEEIRQAVIDLVQVNGLKSCYIRPVLFRGYGAMGVWGVNNPIELYIACWEWGKYLGEEALAKGVDVCVSSWTRIAPNTLPALAKAGANYMNSQLIKMEAVANGFAEGIALNDAGYVSEGSGENLFVVRDNKIITPPLVSSVLPGITRDSVIQIAKDMDIEIVEAAVPRELLYLGDELFFTGTAAEITPIRSVDHIMIGDGRRGPITERLQHEFFALVSGRKEDRHGWLSRVRAPETVSTRG